MAAPKSFLLSPEIHDYLRRSSAPLDPVQEHLIARTAALGDVARMQIAPEEGALLTLLTRLGGVRNAIEIGTFTGYSALCIARGLAPGGRLLCCDVNEEWTAIARDAWERAGVADRIELRLAPAIDTLVPLPLEPMFDLAFIDADKDRYILYYEELVPRLRPGGLLIADNVLWGGRVLDAGNGDASTRAIQGFNHQVAGDRRVEALMLPIADGITIARKLG